jgi:pimeloyl-ACP methyl ester carboxylesterase
VRVTSGRHADASGPTIVLVHGSGHTARVWARVQGHLAHRSLAVDIPGRADRVAPIAEVMLEAATMSLAADVDAATHGALVLVGHSAGGIVLPGLAAHLGARVQHLVFVAGLCAPDGEAVVMTVRPDAVDEFERRLQSLRDEFAGCMLDPDPSVDGMRAIDTTTAAGIDSLNLMSQTVSWAGVPDDVARTFVRCTCDRIQSPELQAALAEHCNASEVIDLESGHTPALAVPAELAALLDRIAEEHAIMAG